MVFHRTGHLWRGVQSARQEEQTQGDGLSATLIQYLSFQHTLVLTMTLTQVVALKKVLMENEKEGFPITALRFFREVLQCIAMH